MRTALAAVFAALVVGVVAWFGWQAIESRVDQEPDSTPTALFETLASAWSDGDVETLRATFREGDDEVLAAVDAIETGLAPESTSVLVEEVDVGDARASATLSVTVHVTDVGDVGWSTTVPATRVRGEWLALGSPDVVHPELRAGDTFAIVREDVARAPIVGHDGTPLTTHGPGRVIGIVPGLIRDASRLRVAWASALPDSVEDLLDVLDRDDLRDDWFYPVVTVPESRYEEVWDDLRGVLGVDARRSDDGTTQGSFAQHVLGRVGEPSAELAEELGVPADQVVGLYGLERAFEDQLVGSARSRVVVRRGDEVVIELATAQEDPSAPVRTTLDRAVQQAAEQALGGVSDNAAVVVIDSASGALRATASRPLAGYNRAFEARYAPGDAFLPVTVEALLAAGVALDRDVACPAETTVVGAQLTSPVDLQETTLVQALAAGCDTTVGALAAELDDGALTDAAARFGFGAEYELVLPSFGGDFPEPVDRTERVRAAVGQARVLVSPVHAASLVAAAVDGAWRPPYLLADEAPEEVIELTGDSTAVLEQGAGSGGSAAALAGTGAIAVAGTAPETGRALEHTWVVGAVDGLAFAVLVEDTGGELQLAETIARSLVEGLREAA